MTAALFIGRFQPFHNAHLTVIKQILKENDKIIIVIGSSNESNTRLNPFSLMERKNMITSVLKANKIKNYRIIAIPDVYNDKKWIRLIESKARRFDTIYTGNKWTARCFRKYGKNIRKIKLIKGISSTIIRNRIVRGKNWKGLVPKEVYLYIQKIRGDERISSI